jgi:hypothetical protein
MKNLKPIVFENSKIPVILSKVAPIEIWAISLFIFVWCRGEISDITRRHETIHFQQQLELLFVFQWILYLGLYAFGLFSHKGNGEEAYRMNPFEREAYENQYDKDYLATRPRYNWIKYF